MMSRRDKGRVARSESPVECYYELWKSTAQARYDHVLQELSDFRGEITKLVEFGCGEMTFVNQLLFKSKGLADRLERICLVDVDAQKLAENVHKLRCTNVQTSRDVPLVVNVYQGSISKYDTPLEGTDAVVGIEIIEHLFPDVLNDLVPNVFGCVRPKIALFTTPNVEYNVNFNLSGFRHFDHKFEWTREQFRDWATNITERFPYRVRFLDIGGRYTEELGAVSQVAIFERLVPYLGRTASFSELPSSCFEPFASEDGLYAEKYTLIACEVQEGLPRDQFIYKKILQYVHELYSGNDHALQTKRLKIPLCDLVNGFNERNYRYAKDSLILDQVETQGILEKGIFKLERTKVPRRGFLLCFMYHGNL